MRIAAYAALAAGLSGLGACGDDLPGEDRQGGAATVDDRTATGFAHALPTLDAAQEQRHREGRGPVNFVWAPPQLGPLFNHSACLACHPSDGRGRSQIEQ